MFCFDYITQNEIKLSDYVIVLTSLSFNLPPTCHVTSKYWTILHCIYSTKLLNFFLNHLTNTLFFNNILQVCVCMSSEISSMTGPIVPYFSRKLIIGTGHGLGYFVRERSCVNP